MYQCISDNLIIDAMGINIKKNQCRLTGALGNPYGTSEDALKNAGRLHHSHGLPSPSSLWSWKDSPGNRVSTQPSPKFMASLLLYSTKRECRRTPWVVGIPPYQSTKAKGYSGSDIKAAYFQDFILGSQPLAERLKQTKGISISRNSLEYLLPC